MVEKVVIRDKKKAPLLYLPKVKGLKGEYTFKTGVNIIVGENGCGKTTLLKLIERYLLVDYNECSAGNFNHNINSLFRGWGDTNDLLDGVDVYADYTKNTFRLCHKGERKGQDTLSSFRVFGEYATQLESSQGEGVIVAINSLFNLMYGKDAKLTFDYSQFKNYPAYCEYVDKHRVTEHDEYTIIMDEPDRNLDLKNIEEILGILSFHKDQTQIIAVVHNPLLIYALSNKDVNIIEMTKGYVSKVKREINKLIK